MQQDLDPKFLLSKLVSADELIAHPKVTCTKFSLKEYNKLRTEKNIDYYIYKIFCGEILIGSVEDKICYLQFVNDAEVAVKDFKLFFPDCNWQHKSSPIHLKILEIFATGKINSNLELLVKGTDFQIKVWKALTALPLGKITCYSEIAKFIGDAGACRAIGSAIGNNHISYLIPCHRVIQKTGKIGGYRWGNQIKHQLLLKELI